MRHGDGERVLARRLSKTARAVPAVCLVKGRQVLQERLSEEGVEDGAQARVRARGGERGEEQRDRGDRHAKGPTAAVHGPAKRRAGGTDRCPGGGSHDVHDPLYVSPP